MSNKTKSPNQTNTSMHPASKLAALALLGFTVWGVPKAAHNISVATDRNPNPLEYPNAKTPEGKHAIEEAVEKGEMIEFVIPGNTIESLAAAITPDEADHTDLRDSLIAENGGSDQVPPHAVMAVKATPAALAYQETLGK